MPISDELLNLYAKEYGITYSTVKRLYEILKNIPCVFTKDEEAFQSCLETLISDRASYLSARNIYQKKFEGDTGFKTHVNTLAQSLDYALYTVYGEEAIPYVSKEFLRENGIPYEENEYDFDHIMNNNEFDDDHGLDKPSPFKRM